MSQQLTDSAGFNDDLFFSLQLDLLCVSNLDGYFIKMNDLWEEVLGYTIEELLNIRLLDLIHPDDLDSTLTAFSTLDTGNNITRFTNRYRHKNGSYRYIEWCSRPINNIVYSCAKDVTTIHLKKEELFRDTKRLNAIIASKSNYIVCLDKDFNIDYMNKKFEEEFHFIFKNKAGSASFLDTFLENSEEFKKDWEMFYLENKKISHQKEIIHLTENNKILYILWTFSCLLDTAKNILEIQCWGVNVTERKEDEIRVANAKAQELMLMSTPITELWDGILLLPLVGVVSSERALQIMHTVLNKIQETQAKVIILDISGIAIVNIQVANYFIQLSKATQLMGCSCTLCGIGGEIAESIVALDITGQLNTTGSMKDALEKSLMASGLKRINIQN